MAGEEEKRITHYSNRHKILLVGEGDFSFAACLANAFGLAPNIIATSLLPEWELKSKHPTADANLEVLKNKGSTIMHEVDVQNMSEHPSLKYKFFDRIVFNFPHAGWSFKEHEERQIQLHQNVVSDFFENARKMLSVGGQVHITHKTAYPFSQWKIEQLARNAGLLLVEEAPFYLWEYPGYVNKRGADGGGFYTSNDSFPVGQCCTFKFVRG